MWQDYFFIRTFQCNVSFGLYAVVPQCSLALSHSRGMSFGRAPQEERTTPGTCPLVPGD